MNTKVTFEGTTMTDEAIQPGLSTATLVALGGLLLAGIGVLLHDPAARTAFVRVAQDPRVRQACLNAAKRVSRETAESWRGHHVISALDE